MISFKLKRLLLAFYRAALSLLLGALSGGYAYILLAPLAYRQRGYTAYGGEWCIILGAAALGLHFGWWLTGTKGGSHE